MADNPKGGVHGHIRTAAVFGAGSLLLTWTAWLSCKDYAVTYRWHALPFHVGVLCVLFVLTMVLSALTGRDKRTSSLFFASVSLCLIVLELVIRATGTEATYIENRSGWYQSSYQQNLENPLRVHMNYSGFWMETPEYRFHRTVNSHGFTDREFIPKKSGEALIQIYGDSFTEGDGAPADSSYPALLRKVFTDSGMHHVKVQNFGKSGNDPGFYWKQLKEVGTELRPDVVLISYGSLDFTVDFFTRGGIQRFHDDKWSALDGPWWEFAYANSHLIRWALRLLFNIDRNSFLTTPSQREQRIIELKPQWIAVFDSILNLSRREGFELLLLKKPERNEISNAKYDFDYAFFDSFWKENTDVRHFDLLDFYLHNRELNADSTARYYWVHDGHHNPDGYHLMAEGVLHALWQNYPNLLRTCNTDS